MLHYAILLGSNGFIHGKGTVVDGQDKNLVELPDIMLQDMENDQVLDWLSHTNHPRL